MGQRERKDKNHNTHLMVVIQMGTRSDLQQKQKGVELKIQDYRDQEI